jgi:hypothetical protein
MSPEEEVWQVNKEVISAAAKGDFTPFVNALDDGVEVFDHVAYLFEGKASFIEHLQSVVAGAEPTTHAFNQFSCRAVTDTTAVVNACDRLATVPKGGGLPKVLCGRA